MKHECNVARDLMPLVLDGAASEESRRLLDEHLEECAACKEYYDGMKAALPLRDEANNEQEQKTFDAAARKLRKKRRRRLRRNILIGVLAGLVIMFGCLWTWSNLTRQLNTVAYHGDYNVFLSQLDDGRVSVNIDYKGSDRYMLVRIKTEEENGEQILYVYNETTRIPHHLEHPMHNHSCIRLSAADLSNIEEIRKGVPADYAVVWQTGDSIPAASREMEAYFALREQITAIPIRETADGKMFALSDESSRRLNELEDQAVLVFKTVPEWQ